MHTDPNDTLTSILLAKLDNLSTTDNIRYLWRDGHEPVFLAVNLDDVVIARFEFGVVSPMAQDGRI